MPLIYVMRPDGFLCGDPSAGVACFAYATSPNCDRAKRHPEQVARAMLAESVGCRHLATVVDSIDALLAELLADSSATVVNRPDVEPPRLPQRVGQRVLVESHNRTLVVGRNGGDRDWHAYVADPAARSVYSVHPRMRFGDRERITADIRHFIATGTLPRSANGTA